MFSEIAVDIGAIVRNARSLARFIAPARLVAVVKANAYGHGLLDVSRALAPHVTRLSVYSLEEAIILRDAGVDMPVHVLGPIPETDLETAHAAKVQMTLWDDDRYAAQVASIAQQGSAKFKIHAKIDTGAARLGVSTGKAADVLARFAMTSEYQLMGAFTLLIGAEDSDWAVTQDQLRRFLSVTRDLPQQVERHAAATAAAILWPETRLDAARCGIGLYGIWPSAEWEKEAALRGLALEPALSWRTQIVALHHVVKDATVGYGRTWHAKRDSRIATLPIGYADGLPREAGNAAYALVHGTRVPIIGRVCMNMAFLDVTGVGGARAGDSVTLIGRDKTERITAEELAYACRTISCEILARIPTTVPRRYHGSE